MKMKDCLSNIIQHFGIALFASRAVSGRIRRWLNHSGPCFEAQEAEVSGNLFGVGQAAFVGDGVETSTLFVANGGMIAQAALSAAPFAAKRRGSCIQTRTYDPRMVAIDRSPPPPFLGC